MGILDNYDLSLKLARDEGERRLSAAQRRMLYLRLVVGGIYDGSGTLGPPICVVFEGWDASGKGGAIARLVAHFLSRFWPHLPGWGGMTILDRSWYGRVLVERVEEFATEEQWRRAYDEIKSFERTLTDEGMVLVKIWMHVSSDELLKRFKSREKDPLKRWKLTAEDWRNREQRPAYELAITEMLDRTDTSNAPWTVVEADNKLYARVKVLETVNAAVESGLLKAGIKLADPD